MRRGNRVAKQRPHMKCAQLLLLTLTGLYFCPAIHAQAKLKQTEAQELTTDYRIWTDASGTHRTNAKLVEIDKRTVTLKTVDGDKIEVQRDQLSAIDKSYLEGVAARFQSVPKKEDYVDVGPPDPDCETCSGSGIVPRPGMRPLVHVYNRGKKKVDLDKTVYSQPIADCCPNCQAGKDPRTLNELHELAEEEALEKHKQWEKDFGQALLRVDTHYLTIRSQLSKTDTVKVARGLEKFESLMQKQLGTMAISNHRRGRDEFFLMDGKKNYQDFVRLIESRDTTRRDWKLLYETVSFSRQNIICCYQHVKTSPIVGHAIYASAVEQINRVIGFSSAPWLHCGFASYYEAAVTKQNISFMAGYRYEKGKQIPNLRNVTVDAKSWNKVIRQAAKQDKLIAWDEIFVRKPGDYEPLHDIQAKSMVAFLLRDPQKFLRLTELFQDKGPRDALSEAYEMSCDELEAAWVKWLR